jgi:hypothetical protein
MRRSFFMVLVRSRQHSPGESILEVETSCR